MIRSLIVLKALTFRPTGGIVAAPTTSLPEQVGGVRNWDYRFCWLRDATLTLLALMNAGYYREAAAWRDWLLRAVSGQSRSGPDHVRPQRRALPARVGAPLAGGYENSRPVRVGNAAHEQLQLDVYGEVLDALHQARVGGIPASDEAWDLEQALIAQLEKIWQLPDQGIWETRGQTATLHALQGDGVGGDGPGGEERRTVRAARSDRPLADASRSHPRRSVRARLQSSLELVRPGVRLLAHRCRHADHSPRRFLPIDDPRVQGTIAAIERNLVVDGLVLRYDTAATDDGLPEGEGAFLACSFWLADNYALSGRHDEARRLFERLLTMCNDLGLLSEEYDPLLKRQVGNFPQAFSHVALLSTAFNLSAGANASAAPRLETGANLPNLRGVA